MNLNMLLKLGNMICAYADFAKFIYKKQDICSQPKNPKKPQICLEKFEYGNRLSSLPYVAHLLFLVQLFVLIYEIYLNFDLGSLALLSILFINILIVI